jgi:hypothetical protein
VESCYACSGRPSVDPVVFFRLQLVMFFEDIRLLHSLTHVFITSSGAIFGWGRTISAVHPKTFCTQ